MGPVEKIVTAFNGEVTEEDFSQMRAQYQGVPYSKRKFFRLSQEQLDMLNERAEKDYISKLTTLAEERYPAHSTNKSVENEFSSTARVSMLSVAGLVEECFIYCKSKSINDDLSIRSMVYLLLEKEIDSVEYMPANWAELLGDESLPGYYRVEKLSKKELGYIPR